MAIMIESEVLNIINKRSVSLQGKLLEELTDQFRSGRNRNDVLKLIASDNVDFIDVGTYILREIIIVDSSILQQIEERLYVLIEHDDSNIRFKSLLILSDLLSDKIDSKDQLDKLLFRMSLDPDKSIQSTAKKILKNGNLM